jgi:hypothetical protein
MRLLTASVLLMVVAGFFAVAVAQDEDLKKYAGYVDLGDIVIAKDAGTVTEVFLGPAVLRLAAKMEGNGDEDLSEALSELKGIQVKSFEIDEAGAEAIKPIMDRIEENIRKKGWERLVLVKSETERVVVSVKPEDDKLVGLLVMALEPGGEAAFVNVIGTINMETIGNLGVDLDESVLDSLKKHVEKSD